jgi:hypothetical protein
MRKVTVTKNERTLRNRYASCNAVSTASSARRGRETIVSQKGPSPPGKNLNGMKQADKKKIDSTVEVHPPCESRIHFAFSTVTNRWSPQSTEGYSLPGSGGVRPEDDEWAPRR